MSENDDLKPVRGQFGQVKDWLEWERDTPCVLCGDLKSAHTKSPAEWRTVPGCSQYWPPRKASNAG